MRRIGNVVQPSTLACDPVVADRVRARAREAGISTLAATSALLERALDQSDWRLEAPVVKVQVAAPPAAKRKK